jgi:8-oxo-dGTP pyrophosphatase MutT (NUDIX family)
MPRPVTTIPFTEVFPIALGPLTVIISRAAPPANSGAVDAAWAKLIARNPRYFDGPLLSVVSLGPASTEQPSNEIFVRRDRFSRLAVQPGVMTGVRILSVTAVLVARDAGGAEHVLLGRRGTGTRIYAGMWELGPSGGLHDPPAAVESLDQAAVFSHLADEIAEEVGLHVDHGTPVCVARDHFAMSDDIVFTCEVGPLEDARGKASAANWEYSEVTWLPVAEAARFDEEHARDIIAPTRALFRMLGWLETENGPRGA